MGEFLFSIIIPVYNVEEYLNECVDSVIVQKPQKSEIILIDDGSTDSSGELCDQLSDKYPFVSVIHQKNGGLSDARNTGIKNSHGEYLIFLDSDDLLFNNSLSNLQNSIIDNHCPDFVISRRATLFNNQLTPCAYNFSNNLQISHQPDKVYEMLRRFKDCWLGVWIFTIKREYCIKHDLFFYKGILHEDEEWVPRLFFNAKSIGFNNEILYCNRIEREGSITATPNIKREFDKLKILDLLNQEFQVKKYDENVRSIVNRRMEQILFGVICEAYLYHTHESFEILLKDIDKHLNFLSATHRRIYKISNLCMSIFGVKYTCQIFYLLNILKSAYKK